MTTKYKRILLKLSGEGLMGDKDFCISGDVLENLAKQIKIVHDNGTDVCLVVGGGNIFRGAKAKDMSRSNADYAGMLATVMNGLFLQEVLVKGGLDARVVSSIDIPRVCESYSYTKAVRHLSKKRVLVFVGGTGNPFFTTDTAAVLRASEMNCEVVLKATQVDGVYDDDPKMNSQAKRYNKVSFDEVIEKNLKVMDMTAIALARENNISIVIFRQGAEGSIVDTVAGRGNFTVIGKEV